MNTATGKGEHQKACYRLLVFGVLALFGPPAFGLRPGWFTVLYGLLLVGYAFWAMRLTVLFHDDDHLGYLLTLFDVALTTPLVIWGREAWLAGPLVVLWLAGLSTSAVLQRRRRVQRWAQASGTQDPATGFATIGGFVPAVEQASSKTVRSDEPYGLLALRVHRFGELVALNGRTVADRSLHVLGRRVMQEARVAEPFRLQDDELVFLVPGAGAGELAALAAAAGAACGRLVEGRRVDTSLGYAVCPRDGYDAAELLRVAGTSFRERPALSRDVAATGQARVAVG
jgi:GGDEF domain-containing protein